MSELIQNVAALYVDPLGPYPKLVEHWWDEQRDARTYAGPWPVVAHPPRGPWSALRHLHKKAGQGELGLLAIEQVRKWGGVLEQPSSSRLSDHLDLRPGELYIMVEQCSWGHVARKPTWLFCVGVPHDFVNATRRTGGTPTHWCSGGRTKRPGMGATVPPGIKVCSAQQRRRTPVAFAEWLISLAASASWYGEPYASVSP